MADMQRKVLLLRSAPATPEAADTLHLATVLSAQGRTVAVMLIQDAVLCALQANQLESSRYLRELAADGAACYYLAGDLAMRGYGPEDVTHGCVPVDYGGLVDLLLADGASVAGAF